MENLTLTEIFMSSKFAEFVDESRNAIIDKRQTILGNAKNNGVQNPKLRRTAFIELYEQGYFHDPKLLGEEFLRIELKESKLSYLQRECIYDFVRNNILRTIAALNKEKETTKEIEIQ